jgi:AcrR family transcriptional regulator
MAEDGAERRRRGRRPADAGERRQKVEHALAELTAARVPFSMADLAERAGISRATLYRDAGLRDLVGGAGDGPANRPVNARDHRDATERAEKLSAEKRALRRQVRELEKALVQANARADELEQENRRYSRTQTFDEMLGTGAADRLKAEAYAEGFAAGTRAYQQRGGGGSGRPGSANADLLSVAQRLPRAAIVNARKTLARALHPDLYAKDPAASLLATELLKQINALAAGPG